MAASARPSRRRQKKLEMIETTYEELSSKPAVEETAEDGEDSDGPVVFICGKCNLAVGDSLSWEGSEEDQNQIRLKVVTANVEVGKEKRIYEVNKQPQCLVADVTCRGCKTVLGIVYTSTPRKLDYKRFAFYLNVAQIDSYVLGSANQITPVEAPDEQPVTMEYKASVDQQLTEMKILLLSMDDRMEQIEAAHQLVGPEHVDLMIKLRKLPLH
ncbi:hypothetical protein D5F01_LYC13501 [Larimichthys crocea]|uniref:Protein Mis18-alpha n=1 Tax=Larimichthys crocea TaxID=215358 RepID=A0A6G0I7X1_LARCR|nr:protein Mis18-alpha [Larimichthys crocea]KAE8287457.1 hypothetical protein D5F01_LYC13501 [Larimichthys crocea]